MRRALACSLTFSLAATLLVFDVVSVPEGTGTDALRAAGAGAEVVSPEETTVPLTASAAATLAPSGTDQPTLVTPEVETQDFSVMGVTWDASSVAGDDVQVQVRVREADGWSSWTELPANDAAPHPGTEEAGLAAATGSTEPLVTDDADALQVRLVTADGEVPEDLEAVVIDPGTAPGDAVVDSTEPLSAADAATAPSIVSRKSWGADESRRRCSPSYSSSIAAAVAHHTAGSNSYGRSDGKAVVRGIYAYHTGALGWCDIGYNFLVDKYGVIYEGRYGGTTEAVRGAHSGGFNDRTFGVSAMGNFETVTASSAMVQAMGRVIGWKLAVHGRPATGNVTLTSAGGKSARYASGRKVTVPTVLAHRDVGLTACPGRNLYAQMGTIRSTAAKAAAPAPAPAPKPVAAPAPTTTAPTTTASQLRTSVVVPVEVDLTTGTELLSYSATGASQRLLMDTTARGAVTTMDAKTWSKGWTNVVPIELDGTKGSEVLVYNRTSGRMAVVETSATGATTTTLSRSWSAGWTHIVPVDIGGSGAGMVVYNARTGTQLVVRLLPGGATPTVKRSTWSKGWSHVSAAEVDRTAGAEVSVYNAASGRHVLVDLGDGTGSGTIAQQFWAKGLDVVAAYEADRTGGSELLTYDASSGATTALDLSSTGRTSTLARHTWTTGWTSMAAVEADGTNGGELVVHNASSGRLLLLDTTPEGGFFQMG